jgi:ABC-type lipoprotein export system ATPase subunit
MFKWQIPKIGEEPSVLEVDIEIGKTVFIVGANGSGKSALVTELTKKYTQGQVIRIAAHRQSTFNSSSVDLTDKGRRDVALQLERRDKQDDSRWKDDYATQRAQAAIYDLVNSENKRARDITRLIESGDIEGAQSLVNRLSPINSINHILSASTLNIALSIDDEGDVSAKNGSGAIYSMVQLSDGERNAVMLASQVLTAAPGSLFIIDEPERHLHKAITEPLLSALFKTRNDCSFVVATHEPELPHSDKEASVIIVRSCKWNNQIAVQWDVDVLSPDITFPEETKKAILGSRRYILFTEGEVTSLDFTLYSVLFPTLSIVPLGSCKEVIKSVRGLREVRELHWIHPVGLIDRDSREQAEVNKLAESGIFALDSISVESIFYSPEAIKFILNSLPDKDKGGIDKTTFEALIEKAFKLLDVTTRRKLAARRIEKSVHDSVLTQLPSRHDIEKTDSRSSITITADIPFQSELDKLNKACTDTDYTVILNRYQIKNTRITTEIAKSLGFNNREEYELEVIRLAKESVEFANKLRLILGPVNDYLAIILNPLANKVPLE